MEFQFKLFELGRLQKAEKILKGFLHNHAKKRNFQKVLENILSIIENYQNAIVDFGIDHEDFELDRISCFVEIIIQSTISCSLYCHREIDELQKLYGQEDFDLISRKCRDALLTFWQKGIMLKPRIKNALDHGWNQETFIILLKRN